MRVCMHACVCVCVRACMMYDTDQCHIHLNSLWFVCVWGGGGGAGGGGGGGGGCGGCGGLLFLSFRMMLCVGCFGGTVLYVCIEYHI